MMTELDNDQNQPTQNEAPRLSRADQLRQEAQRKKNEREDRAMADRVLRQQRREQAQGSLHKAGEAFGRWFHNVLDKARDTRDDIVDKARDARDWAVHKVEDAGAFALSVPERIKNGIDQIWTNANAKLLEVRADALETGDRIVGRAHKASEAVKKGVEDYKQNRENAVEQRRLGAAVQDIDDIEARIAAMRAEFNALMDIKHDREVTIKALQEKGVQLRGKAQDHRDQANVLRRFRWFRRPQQPEATHA